MGGRSRRLAVRGRDHSDLLPHNRVTRVASDYCPGWNNASEKVIIGIRIRTYCLAVSTTACNYLQSEYAQDAEIPAHVEVGHGEIGAGSKRKRRCIRAALG